MIDSGKKKILIICYSELNRDPRVLRQIDTMGEIGDVITAGLEPSRHPSEKRFIQLSFRYQSGLDKTGKGQASEWQHLIGKLLIDPVMHIYSRLRQLYYFNIARNYDSFHWTPAKKQALKSLVNLKADLIVANDTSALALAVKLKQETGARLCYDAHEYSPLEFDNDSEWLRTKAPYITFLCKTYLPQTDYCTTIGRMIADKYFELTGIRFGIVYNAPAYQDLKPVFRKDGKIKCVHQGIATPIRRIEDMIEAFRRLGQPYELHLYLLASDKEYYRRISDMASASDNIFFHAPVATAEIPACINQYDIMLNFIPPVNFNYTCGLPNKFFEAVQARLMLVCGPLEEQAQLINDFGLGKTANGFSVEDIEAVMLEVTEAGVSTCKMNADKAAQPLAAENIMRDFQNKMRQLLNQTN
jgi:glycosyltransferase involved in cell wall biosynthesis